MERIRKLDCSRNDFNESMRGYRAIVVQTERTPFNQRFFTENKIPVPRSNLYYVPPSWVGISNFGQFLSSYRSSDGPKIFREEAVPEVDSSRNFLICDDYAFTGKTFEIAMARLVAQGVSLDNIWCLTNDGSKETGNEVTLDSGQNWHEYHLRHESKVHKELSRKGFLSPGLIINA